MRSDREFAVSTETPALRDAMVAGNGRKLYSLTRSKSIGKKQKRTPVFIFSSTLCAGLPQLPEHCASGRCSRHPNSRHLASLHSQQRLKVYCEKVLKISGRRTP